MALIKNTKVNDYVVGFYELGGTDGFAIEGLEERLAKSGIVTLDGESSGHRMKAKVAPSKKSIQQGNVDMGSDSED